MRRAFRSLRCPEGFSLELIDNDTFITVKAKEKVFMSLETVEKKKQAIEYMIRVKKALEDNGAIVLLVREGGKEL
jgi:cytochrome c-type biogenesis protein CcmH/NrfF